MSLPKLLTLIVLACALAAEPASAATFTPTGDLNAAREQHLATILLDGRVLVIGGTTMGGSDQLSSAEVFSPASGNWTSTGTLDAPRWASAAALLESGKVLVAGGFAGGNQNTAEVYNPATNLWAFAPGMGAGKERHGHTATLLGDGRLLVIGGRAGSALADSRIFNPAGSGSWSDGSSLTTARSDHTATLLANGKVLIVGGLDSTIHPLQSAELYVPGTGVSSAGNMAAARLGHTATLLQDGRVLVAGGTGTGDAELDSAEIYDPGTSSWSPAGHMATARNGHTATLLRDGRVLVTGGFNANGDALSSTETYDPATNSWSIGPALTGARADHTATGLVDGRVLAAAGFGSSALNSAELFAPGPSPSAVARHPVVAYVDPDGHFGLYDSETGADIPPPPLPAGITRFGMSLGGRYVAWADPAAPHHIHLYDRIAHGEVPLPGIDLAANPDGLTVSNTGLLAFDDNSNGPARVYDSKTKTFVDTGIVAFDHDVNPDAVPGHRQTRLSGDGRFLATTCQDHCVTDSGGDPDLYVQDLTTRQNFPMPNDSPAAQDAEHPCIDGNGGLVGLNLTHPAQKDVFLYDRLSSGLLPLPNDPTASDVKCAIDSSGQHVVLQNETDGTDRLYDRLTGALVPLPAKVRGLVFLSDPIDMTPPETTITAGPAARTTQRSAQFLFTSSEAGSTFQCKLDAGAFAACTPPHTLGTLKPGTHTLAVRATDASNNTDPTPATRTWTIVDLAKLSALRIKPRSFLAQSSGPTIAKKKKRGATVSFRLSAEAKVIFKVQRLKRNRHGRLVWASLKGKLSRLGAAGQNKLHFSGRWRGKKLKPGRYRLVVTPVPGPKKHAAQRAKFRILRK